MEGKGGGRGEGGKRASVMVSEVGLSFFGLWRFCSRQGRELRCESVRVPSDGQQLARLRNVKLC
eukprot:6196334-Pleurochrysis_carterae.AAC.2